VGACVGINGTVLLLGNNFFVAFICLPTGTTTGCSAMVQGLACFWAGEKKYFNKIDTSR